MKPNWYLYIAECSDESLYVGITTDLKKRIRTHNLGKGAIYTRGRRPITLKYSEKIADESQARKREKEVKKWPRKKKQMFINGNSEQLKPLHVSSGQ